MYATIQKWGNSQAIRLPKMLLEMVSLKENDKVELKVQEGKIILIPVKKQLSLKERIAEYQGDYQVSEWETGEAAGNEVL